MSLPLVGPSAPRGGGPKKTLISRISSHLRIPLYRNGYALILSTGLTSALGFVYWLVAARLYPAEVVGLNSAVLSSMMFLSGLALLSLQNVLIRYIPRVRSAALTLTNAATAVTMLAGLAAGLIFVLGIDFWTPSLGFMRSSPLLVGSFAISTAAWGVFTLQEGVFLGMRDATWIPIRNGIFAVAKIGLLFPFVVLLPAYGIFMSWMIPAVVLILPVVLLVRRRLMRRVEWEEPEGSLVLSRVVRYAAADYVASLFLLGSTMLVPVLVTEMAGPKANAYFYLAWTIALPVFMVAQSMGSSLIVESGMEPSELGTHISRAILQSALLVIPIVAVLIVAAPYILGFLGKGYSAEGTIVLQLLALSAIPNIGNELYMSVARAQRKMGVLVMLAAARCVLVLALSYFLLPDVGIMGVGVAWLATQSGIAALLLIVRRSVVGQIVGKHLRNGRR